MAVKIKKDSERERKRYKQLLFLEFHKHLKSKHLKILSKHQLRKEVIQFFNVYDMRSIDNKITVLLALDLIKRDDSNFPDEIFMVL